ncbi:hypothetical protein QQF64_024202 [Cirrhinus molitorella]|uniref:Neurotransmitter-gated ion-channel ligand-binding domain-containing protein n=1 Tax=Cirrhinus molitorella TaxID=172907 RepID=A0ABR3NKL0_9TELE
MNHLKADVNRLYIKRCNGGHGLIELESAYSNAIVSLSKYIERGSDKVMKMVKKHKVSKTKYSQMKMANEICKHYGLLRQEDNPESTKTIGGKQSGSSLNEGRALRDNIEQDHIKGLKKKALHSKFFKHLNEPSADKEASLGWLGSSSLKGETASLIIADGDHTLNTSIKTEFGTKESPYVKLIYHGFIASSDILSLTTACRMDLYKFPFDSHTCNITLQSTAYSIEEIKLTKLTNAEWMTFQSKETFHSQGEWEFLGINGTNSTAQVVWLEMDQLMYQITIKRRPLLYAINLMLPVFLFLLLDVTSFFILGSGTDKLNFKMTLLLSISVFLLILNDTLPSTAEQIPLIAAVSYQSAICASACSGEFNSAQLQVKQHSARCPIPLT